MQCRMKDERQDDAPRRLPVVGQAPRTISTRYSPDVLAAIAVGEAAALAPLVARDVMGAIDAAAMASVHAEQFIQAAKIEEPPEMPIACRRGCSTCCQAKVLAVAPEVLRIGDYLRKNKSTKELAELLERIREADTKTRGLSRESRAEIHVSCPLLDEDGGCSIHDVRPLVCRSWTSYDASACETYWQSPRGKLTPPQWPVGYELAQAMLAGLGKACLDRGLDGLPLEFIAALRIVLERPIAGERWLKNLPVFLAARDAEWAQANGRG
jgi:Fe-S-cluster containining protein